MTKSLPRLLVSLLIVGLVGCGGGGESSVTAASAVVRQDTTATDGLARFNYWRNQLGLSSVAREGRLDTAAFGHSNYQVINALISHYQTPGNPGFTGECMGDVRDSVQCAPEKQSRLEAAGYDFTQGAYAFGEVISRTASTSGAAAADALIAAIYHRFVIFEPMFKQAGAGAASSSDGPTYFTTNFTADGLNVGLGHGNSVVFPHNGQQNVQRNFFSDQEVPDPVPSRNEVGYPISLHADIVSSQSNQGVVVQSFTIRPQGGNELATQRLWNGVDANTPASVAAIVPLDVLAPNTTYEVQFSGTVHGVPVNRSWSFTTGS